MSPARESADFLLEIGVEELPTSYITPALAQLERDLKEELAEARLPFADCATFATPRRLAVLLTDLALRQEDYEEEATGPPVSAAYDKQGQPTNALLGFCRGRGVEVSAVRQLETARGTYVAVTLKRAGRPAGQILSEACLRVVPGLGFPKTMRWLDQDFRFARPIRWLVALLGDDPLALELAGVAAGRTSRGHRALHPGGVAIPHPTRYVEALAGAGVVADPRLREEVICEQIEQLAAQAGGRLVADPELLEINNFLIEKPQAFLGRFDESYLDLPREVIVTALREHQRYFAVEGPGGALLPVFLGVRNGDERNLEAVTAGHAAVLRARLDDARFYWDTDLRKPPAERVPELDRIVWLEGMGSVGDKSTRLQELAPEIARAWEPASAAHAARAALLCKTDLLSEMIGSGKEYASLEGVMGAYYAERHGEPAAVVAAIRDHVRPRFPGDALPETGAGAALAVADRVDSVAGCFLAGKTPSGSEDPYGVRRAANGVLRILLEQARHLDLAQTVAKAAAGFGRSTDPKLPAKLAEFWQARVAAALEERGYAYDEVAAALGGEEGFRDPVDAERRAAALRRWRSNENFRPLVIGFKRVANILKADPEATGGRSGATPYDEPAEAALARALEQATAQAEPLFTRRDYDAVLGVLLGLRAPIDRFFDAVLVNVEDADVRRRRLGLLQATRALFDRGWDLGRVVVEG